MKKYIFQFFLLAIVTAVFLSSCDDDDEGSGNAKVAEVTPLQAPASKVVTVTGSGLRDVASISFETDNVEAEFNPNFNTDKAILFRVPADAIPGEQDIIFTKLDGKEFRVPFTVLGLANILDVSNYNFSAGETLTLTGKNLDDVTSVAFAGTTTELEIVEKTATTLKVTFPATDLIQTKLDITNEAGMATTTQEFVARDNVFPLFIDAYADGYQDASWGDGGVISTDVFKSGTASVYKNYAAGNWHLIGFGWTNTANNGYEHLSFWIKGGSKTYDLYISTSASVGGFASFEPHTKITVPANVWTYFKIPVATLKLWATATEWNQIGWRIQGPDGADERFYLDDVMLIKND